MELLRLAFATLVLVVVVGSSFRQWAKMQLTGKNGSDVSSAWSLVAYDDLGAGVGDAVLYVEGAEAMQPFDRPIPLDAITVALLDTYKFTPPTES